MKANHTKNSIWKVVGNNKLSVGNPVTAEWNNKSGLIFRKKIELDDGSEQIVGMTSFGAKYRVLDGMFTSMEYVRIDDEGIDGYDPQADYIRLSIGVDF